MLNENIYYVDETILKDRRFNSEKDWYRLYQNKAENHFGD